MYCSNKNLIYLRLRIMKKIFEDQKILGNKSVIIPREKIIIFEKLIMMHLQKSCEIILKII